jgi:hypothetical protein
MGFDVHPSVVPLEAFVPLALHQDLGPETRASIPAPRTRSRLTRLPLQHDVVPGSRQRSAHDAHDLRTVSVRGDRHLGGGVQLGQQRVRLGPGQLLAALVDAPGSFLERVVGRENGSEGGDNRRRRRGHQQGGKGPVIEPQLRRDGQRVTPLPVLGRWEVASLLGRGKTSCRLWFGRVLFNRNLSELVRAILHEPIDQA